MAQFEKIGQAAFLVLQHDAFVAVAAVATIEGGPLVAREFFQGLPESGQPLGGGVLVAGAHFDAEADAQVRHEVTVINVTGTAGFLGIVADLGSLLVAVERLDGDVDVENPRQT